MTKKKQIILIHGGDTFDTYEEYLEFLKDWQIDFERIRQRKKDWKETLAEKLGGEYEVIAPKMPNKQNAKYLEWKIWFEKVIPYLEAEVTLVGHSLGGIFLAKYLSENQFPKRILGVFLVAACYDDKNFDYSLADFEKYKKALPKAIAKEFTDKGHFNQEEFPELVEDIKSIS